MFFQKIKLAKWQQFQNIEIEFHDKLTVITGANGSGKTTILANILAKHCGWQFQSGATPKKDKESGTVRFFAHLFNGKDKSQEDDVIGELLYADNTKAMIKIHKADPNSPQYQIQIQPQQNVECLFIPPHGPIFRYQAISNLPLTSKNKKDASQEATNATRERYLGGGNQTTSILMKNTLIGWAIKYGNEVIERDEESIGYYEGFQEVLRKLLPPSLKFQKLEIRKMEIVLVCNDGKDQFIFEQVSGGVSALIDIAWQIYMFSTKENSNFTVIIDEIENHLHPTMQRQILPDLLKAFPDIRFIVSTHSPLVVGSVKESNVYALRYDEEAKVVSEKLDLVNKAKTATEILDEVLGVSFTMPIWAEDQLKQIIDNYQTKEMTKEEFAAMRSDLEEMGLDNLMPEAVSKLIEAKNDSNQ